MNSPYSKLPRRAFWQTDLVSKNYKDFDPAPDVKFKISKSEKIASAGSCFAQHMARHLKLKEFNYFVTEDAHPLIPQAVANEFNYGTYTARYGNIYTSRQLLQLFKRAFGQMSNKDDIWRQEDGRFIDPYRPNVHPGGFDSEEEYWADRRQHLAAVRTMFEEADCYIYTFGLTECWLNRADGAAYPLCPGVSGGDYDEAEHQFVNFGVDEIYDDFKEFTELVRSVNPNIKFVVTVSPVPLVATMSKRHVLEATTYSKSVLRVVCEKLHNEFADIQYFPAYEIITGSYSRGRYFAKDLRSVTEQGVKHVMRVFFKHLVSDEDSIAEPQSQSWGRAEAEVFLKENEEMQEVICDEEMLAMLQEDSN